MKKQQPPVMRVQRIDQEKKRTPDQQMRAIRGMSIDDFIKALQRNEGGRYDGIFLSQ